MKKGKSRNKRKKTRSRLLWIAIAVIGIAAVISAVCVAGMLATKENVWRTPEELLVEYMDHIPKQEYEEMYEMLHYESVDSFLEDCASGKSGSIVIYEIHDDGAIGRIKFIYDGTDMYVVSAGSVWNENGKSRMSYISHTRIKEWEYTEKGWFCYELCVPEPPEVTEIVDGSCLIRVKPMTEEQREMSERCVRGLGYLGNNILCSNWDADHMEELDFNSVGMFDSVEAVGFQDIDGDGAKDVIVIVNYITGAGPQGMIPRKTIRIFSSQNDGFVIQHDLIDELMKNMKEDDISISAICDYVTLIETDEIYDGYRTIYQQYFADEGCDFMISYSASGNSRVILNENEEIIEILAYDRLSENEKCELYVLYRSKKNVDGSWHISEAEILDIFAYNVSTKDVVSSGKTSWSATGNEKYYEVTGEK